MSNSNKIGAVILGAAVAVALLKFYSMEDDEREDFFSHLKERAHDLLDDAEGTVEKVKHHFSEIDTKAKEEWVDKLFVLRKLIVDLFGSTKRFLT